MELQCGSHPTELLISHLTIHVTPFNASPAAGPPHSAPSENPGRPLPWCPGALGAAGVVSGQWVWIAPHGCHSPWLGMGFDGWGHLVVGMISSGEWEAPSCRRPRKWNGSLVAVMAVVMLVTDTTPAAEAQARS